MLRPRSPFSCAALAALALALASTARAQDDVPALAKRAEEMRAKLQEGLAAGSAFEKLLRLDKIEAGDGALKVTGAFLQPQPAAKEEQSAYETLEAEFQKRINAALGTTNVKVDLKGVARVAAAKHPHVVLQQASNAAGATDPAADRFRFTASAYGPTGALVVSGLRAPGDDSEKWLKGELAKLGPANGAALKGGKPDVTDAVKAVEWPVTAGAVQKLLAAREEPAARRLRAERAYFRYKTDDKGTVDASELRLFVSGARLGTDNFDVALLNAPIQKLWPDVIKVGLLDLDLIRKPAPEPVGAFRAELAKTVAVTAVRADPGAEFDATGALTFKGVRPELSEAETRALTAAWQRVLKALAAKGDDAAPEYARLAAAPVSAAKMERFSFDKVLAGARQLAAAEMDDALVSRLYFGDKGQLLLQVRTVAGATRDVQKLDARFKELRAEFLGKLTAPDGTAEPALEPLQFERSFTARLRKAMADDQQKWNGVLIERGYFDAAGRYTVRGVVDTAAQNEALDTELTKIAAENPKVYGPFLYEDGESEADKKRTANKPALDVIPMKALVDRTKRVAPAYAALDGVRVLGARYDADVNLVFDAHVVGRPDPTAPDLLAKLLRQHPEFKRRAPADKRVVIAPVTANPADEQLANFGMAYGAKLLAASNPTPADTAKAREWLEAARLHYPNEAGVWFLSAYFHHTTGDKELARRDMFRVVELEGFLSFNGPVQRKRRSDAAKDLQGAARAEVDALWLDAFRATKDGERPITMTPAK